MSVLVNAFSIIKKRRHRARDMVNLSLGISFKNVFRIVETCKRVGRFCVFTCFWISAHVVLSIRVSILDVSVGAIVWAYGVEYG